MVRLTNGKSLVSQGLIGGTSQVVGGGINRKINGEECLREAILIDAIGGTYGGVAGGIVEDLLGNQLILESLVNVRVKKTLIPVIKIQVKGFSATQVEKAADHFSKMLFDNEPFSPNPDPFGVGSDDPFGNSSPFGGSDPFDENDAPFGGRDSDSLENLKSSDENPFGGG